MKHSHILVTYLVLSFIVIINVPNVNGGEYQHSDYSSYEPKKYEYHHHDYHPPAPKKPAANIDVNIPLDFGTLAKFGILGLTQLKLLFALGKIAGAGLGVGALGLSQLGKIGLSVAPSHHKGKIDIDIGAGGHHHHSHHHREGKSYPHYEQGEKHIDY